MTIIMNIARVGHEEVVETDINHTHIFVKMGMVLQNYQLKHHHFSNLRMHADPDFQGLEATQIHGRKEIVYLHKIRGMEETYPRHKKENYQ